MMKLKPEIRSRHGGTKSEGKQIAFRRLAFLLALFLACFQSRVRAEGPASPAPAAASSEHIFDQTNLIALLTSTLQDEYVKEKGDLELKVSQTWAPHKVSDEPVTIKILDMPTMGVTTSFIVKFELLNGDKSLGTWQLPVQAHIWREVWVAHSMLKRGDSLADADIAHERRDMLMIHEPLAEFSPGDSTLEIAEPVGMGAPLFARCVRLTPVVHRGQIVTALVEDGSLSIAMKVTVLEDGSPGQTVRARNQQSLRDIRGKVLNEQTILVTL